MLNHADVWRAIDRIASEYGFSASVLAKRSGLDPTTFNKRKRVTAEGNLRWPSTESVAKVLAATGATFNEYVSYIGDSGGAGVYRHIPLIDFPKQAPKGFSTMGDTPQVAAGTSFPFPASQTHKLTP